MLAIECFKIRTCKSIVNVLLLQKSFTINLGNFLKYIHSTCGFLASCSK